MLDNQNLILIEGTATYERILSEIREVEDDEKLRHIQDFLKIYPDFARAHNDLAVMYYQAANPLKALAHYEKAHKLDPDNLTYRKNLADFYFVELEWTRDALGIYQDIVKNNPQDIESLNALGTISLQIGRKEQARRYFSRTLQIEATNMNALQALQQLPTPVASSQAAPAVPGVSPTFSQAPPKAETQVNSFKELFRLPASNETPTTKACNSLPSANTPVAQTDEPARSPEDLYREALLIANAGKNNEAISLLEKVLFLDNTHAAAHNDLGVIYQKTNKLDKSRKYHEEACRLQPACKVFQKNLADLLFVEFAELEEALKIYVDLLRGAPQDIEILKAIATICKTIGNKPDARYFLERVLSLQPWDREAQELLKNMETAEKAGNNG